MFDINEERGEALAAELAGSVFWPGATDVAGEESVISSIEKGVTAFGNISGVVNCGGVGMAQKVRQRLPSSFCVSMHQVLGTLTPLRADQSIHSLN